MLTKEMHRSWLETAMAGINVMHVPYQGVPAALDDTIAGRVHYTVGSPVSTLPHVKDGALAPARGHHRQTRPRADRRAGL